MISGQQQANFNSGSEQRVAIEEHHAARTEKLAVRKKEQMASSERLISREKY